MEQKTRASKQSGYVMDDAGKKRDREIARQAAQQDAQRRIDKRMKKQRQVKTNPKRKKK